MADKKQKKNKKNDPAENVSKMLDIAYQEKGYKEGANDSNKFGKWYGMNNQPWCAIFVCWVAYQGFGDAYTKYIYKSAMAKSVSKDTVKYRGGSWVKTPEGKVNCKPQPGDLFYQTISHVGYVYSVVDDGKAFWSIEGNYSNGVASAKHRVSDIECIVRPKWGEVGNKKVDGGSAGGGTSENALISAGSGIDLSDTIKVLMSSDRFKYVTAEENTSESDGTKSFTESIIGALRGLSSNRSSTESTQIVQPVEEAEKKISLLSNENIIYKTKLNNVTTNLLSYPTFVEAPIIEVDFNGVTVGGYGNSGDTYPNYLSSMQVKKTNGRINEYVLHLTYHVRPGEDPNAIDKLISRTGYTNTLKIKYGDSNMPSMLFTENNAIITDVTFDEDITSHTINYTIKALSSLSSLQAANYTFKSMSNTKPSNAIYDLLYNSNSSKILLDAFPGMRNKAFVSSHNLIPTSDAVINIGGMSDSSPLTYLSYLVSCMSNGTSSYFLTFEDGLSDDFEGSYFKITEVDKTSDKIITNTSGVSYEIDVGYPTDNFVTKFELINDVYFPLIYDYNGNFSKYQYEIDNAGNIISNKVNPLLVNNKFQKEIVNDSNWWTHVTEYPISARLTLKGLLKPVMLISNLKVNTQFYGKTDMASGMYVITEQVDDLSSSGYTTTLTLLRTNY